MPTSSILISQQQKTIEDLSTQNQLLTDKNQQLLEAYNFLQSQVDALKRMIFGSKSERFTDPENKQPSLLDDTSFSNIDSRSVGDIEAVAVKSHSRSKKLTVTKPLPRKIIHISIPQSEMICNCGAHKQVFKTEVKEILHYVPAVFEIIEQHREVAACQVCQSGVVTAPVPVQILPKLTVSEEFLANLVISKIDDRQPLYHLEQKLALHGVSCSRQNMARWLIELASPLRPLYNLLKDVIIGYDVASCDATGLQVLKEPGRSPQTKSDI